MDGAADFRIAGHRDIWKILTCHLDHDLLKETDARFGGGTLVSMRHGEYRESVDVDFLLCKSRPFSAVKGQVRSITDLKLAREPVVEKDAVRLWVEYEGRTVKIEFIHEQRFAFGSPDNFCGINALNDMDLMACKLFAYSDRSIYAARPGKDISDILAVFRKYPEVMFPACMTVYAAYGSWFAEALKRLYAAEEGSLKDILASVGVSDPYIKILAETAPGLKAEIRRIIQEIEKQETFER